MTNSTLNNACIVLVVFGVLLTCASGMKLDFAEFMSQHRPVPFNPETKRGPKAGNDCPTDMPFPCKTTNHCIPMKYLCDDNIDCEDGYDENRDVCTAARRPAVDQIERFLKGEESWIMSAFFGNKDISKVAHGLAVSESLEDFRQRLNMPAKYMEALRTGLEAVRDQDEQVLESYRMPGKSWGEVEYIFSMLIKDNFID